MTTLQLPVQDSNKKVHMSLGESALQNTNTTPNGGDETNSKIRRLLKLHATEVEALRKVNVAEAQELVAFRRSLKQRESALAAQAKQLLEREAALEKRAFDVAVAERCVKDSQAALDAREVASILRMENAHQSRQLEVIQAEDRLRLLLENVEVREGLLAAKGREEREALMAIQSEISLRERALRAEVTQAGMVLDEKRREVQERCQKLEKRLAEVLAAQEKLHAERAVLECKTVAFEARKSGLLARLHTFVTSQKGTDDKEPAAIPTSSLEVDIQRGKEQLDFLGAFVRDSGLPGEGLKALALSLEAIKEQEQMDDWWRELGFYSQSMMSEKSIEKL